MPTSLDPEPAENEIECAQCGAHFYFELSRCPNCGVNLYEPEDRGEENNLGSQQKGVLDSAKEIFHKIFNKPYAADDVFGASLDQAILYNDLLSKVSGDHSVADRLIDFELQRLPNSTRYIHIKNAIQRWENDNQQSGRS